MGSIVTLIKGGDIMSRFRFFSTFPLVSPTDITRTVRPHNATNVKVFFAASVPISISVAAIAHVISTPKSNSYYIPPGIGGGLGFT